MNSTCTCTIVQHQMISRKSPQGRSLVDRRGEETEARRTVAARAMFSGEQTIQDGSLVIVYEDHKRLSALRVTSGQTLQNRFGTFPHDAMIGRQYGEQMRAKSGRGYIYLLAPSPELWTSSLSHRTQILYVADISMICLQLELMPGCIVIEAGTGSGSLTHALARGVGDEGHVHTYEFNSARAEQAAKELEINGLSPGRVTCRHGDVCKPDWEYEGLAHDSVDAAFFDLPQPWVAVPRVAPYIRPGGRLCTFWPVLLHCGRTLELLPSLGFTQAEVVEVLVRTHEARIAPKTDAITDLLSELSRKSCPVDDATTSVKRPASVEGVVDPPEVKRPRVDANATHRGGEGRSPAPGMGCALAGNTSANVTDAHSSQVLSQPPRLITKPYGDMRGHTGFLMFCSKHVG